MFHFKNFSLSDDATPMKIGVDSVLLGCWADVSFAKSALDIGSGCGLLSFILKDRMPHLNIVGIEIHPGAYADSVQNLKYFPNSNNIEFFNQDVSEFQTDSLFDFIISNPPYFTSDIKPIDSGRRIARFGDALDFRKLADNVKRLLSPNGLFAAIINTENYDELNKEFVGVGMSLVRQTKVRHSSNHLPKRYLCEFSFQSTELLVNELIIKDENGDYAEVYKKLTCGFYLHFNCK